MILVWQCIDEVQLNCFGACAMASHFSTDQQHGHMLMQSGFVQFFTVVVCSLGLPITLVMFPAHFWR